MIRSKLSSLREYLTPINHASNFATTGEISPEEFVKAGDYLVYKFPTWQWSSAPEKLRKDFLPADKQYLITKHVPSHQRCADYLGVGADGEDEEEEDDDGEGWVKSKSIKRSVGEEESGSATETKNEVEATEPSKDVDDIDDLVEVDAEGDDEEGDSEYENDGFSEFIEGGGSQNSLLRKYDLYITYSTSYRVPKLYLVGFNSNGIPLLPKQMFEDISGDYRDKTATIENLPVSFNTTSVSIHPCKHSSVMKVLMAHVRRRNTVEDEDAESPEEGDTIRVDQYLIIFLKFIASVTPGIEYDYTMDAL
ncbi:autophagy-related protein 3 [[Candida] railenensis]|uniref:Autophagy-related protein 3 n=1 Tax=[Candida] railenensis TaxID=45579 RepID=A0A9P0W1E1_9ASCO|nr:autophagy-related protein 3 [[Candida] railenensis]